MDGGKLKSLNKELNLPLGQSVIKEDRRENLNEKEIAKLKKLNVHQKSFESKEKEIEATFKNAKKGMINYKKQLKKDIFDALIEKQEFETKCENLSKNPERWRLIRRRLKFWAMFRIFNQEVKIYGQTVYKQYYKDNNVKLDCMRSKELIFEEEDRSKIQLYEDDILRYIWTFILTQCYLYTAVITPLRLSVFQYSNTNTWNIAEFVISIQFMIDIFISFISIEPGRTTYLSIIIGYSYSWLIPDIMACLPLKYLISYEKFWGINKLIKLPKFFKLSGTYQTLKIGSKINSIRFFKKIIDFLNISESVLTLLVFFSLMLLVTHITGCLWLFMAKLYDFGPETWVYEYGDEYNKIDIYDRKFAALHINYLTSRLCNSNIS